MFIKTYAKQFLQYLIDNFINFPDILKANIFRSKGVAFSLCVLIGFFIFKL